jgi:phospholipase/carboxylesterase
MLLEKFPLQSVFVKAQDSTPPASSPILIVLHGRGDSPSGFSWLPDALTFPQLDYLFLQAPDDYYGGYSWYDLPPHQLPGIIRSRRLLEEVLNELEKQGYLFKNMILFGFSQGCLMTLELGGRFRAKLGGYIGISGYVYDTKALIFESRTENKFGNWLITHGTSDEVLPVEHTRAQIAELKDAQFKIDYFEFQKNHTIDERVELPLLRNWIAERMMKQ